MAKATWNLVYRHSSMAIGATVGTRLYMYDCVGAVRLAIIIPHTVVKSTGNENYRTLRLGYG